MGLLPLGFAERHQMNPQKISWGFPLSLALVL